MASPEIRKQSATRHWRRFLPKRYVGRFRLNSDGKGLYLCRQIVRHPKQYLGAGSVVTEAQIIGESQ